MDSRRRFESLRARKQEKCRSRRCGGATEPTKGSWVLPDLLSDLPGLDMGMKGMRGHKRWRSGAWRLGVFARIDAETGKQRYVNETVHAPNNRVGAKAADARLAELIAAVESGRTPEPARKPEANVLTVDALAARWQAANRPRQNERTGDWIGWSPKTAKTHADKFRRYYVRRSSGRMNPTTPRKSALSRSSRATRKVRLRART